MLTSRNSDPESVKAVAWSGSAISHVRRQPFGRSVPEPPGLERPYETAGLDTAQLPLIERKERLQRLFKKDSSGLRYSEHVAGDGPRFREQACKLGLEGVISKQADRPYAPGDRGIWVKSKCLNREEFVVVGWTDPESSRSHIGALLLGFYTDDGRLHCRTRRHRHHGQRT